MKDFEFITTDEYARISGRNLQGFKKNGLDWWVRQLNDLLRVKAERGYTSMAIPYDEDEITTISEETYDKPLPSSTHEAFVFLRKIEEEKKECLCKAVRDFMKDHQHIIEMDCVRNHCPHCGRKLV